MSLSSGDRAWILFAKVDEASGSEPALDPSSFSWMPVTVKDVAPDEDGLPGAWVILEDGAHAWYERRFLLTEEEARAVLLPSRPGGRERFLERARKGGPLPHGILAAGPLKPAPVYTLRPVFAFPGLTKPVLLVSFEDAVRVLGDGWAGTLYHVFASGEGVCGVWALPHPDAHPPSE